MRRASSVARRPSARTSARSSRASSAWTPRAAASAASDRRAVPAGDEVGGRAAVPGQRARRGGRGAGCAPGSARRRAPPGHRRADRAPRPVVQAHRRQVGSRRVTRAIASASPGIALARPAGAPPLTPAQVRRDLADVEPGRVAGPGPPAHRRTTSPRPRRVPPGATARAQATQGRDGRPGRWGTSAPRAPAEPVERARRERPLVGVDADRCHPPPPRPSPIRWARAGRAAVRRG